MWQEPRLIGEWHRPRLFWKFGLFAEAQNGFPYAILGLGIIAVELHVMPWGNNFDIDLYVNSPFGHIGVNFGMRKEEDDDGNTL